MNEEFETTEQILHGVKVLLRSLKWTRRAIKAGKLIVSPQRRQAIEQAITCIETFITEGRE